ncbi:MAG: polysaccharide deacetylase family protein [Alphaproteobacteria bacterium]|nr:polysaccharide deacetylase family protein [Alphaproteobacteria bacterium]
MCLHDFRAKLNRAARRFLPLAFSLAIFVPELAVADGAVIAMYHRVGEEGDFPSTSVSKAQFEAHIALLESGPYTVWPLEKIVDALKSGQKVPDRTVAITFDDAYLSVYEEAWPRLRRAGFPFTLFVSTKSVDSGAERFMSWDQLREMTAAGVTIGNHTRTHLHMAAASEDRNRAEIDHARERLKKELAVSPRLFAYPYGEMSSAVRELVIAEGFAAAFGQHSGVAHGTDDFFFLPRFAFNQRYGDLDRFRRSINAMPLPVQEITPVDPLVASNPPAFGFSVDASMTRLNQLACYHSQFGKVEVTRLGERRVEIRFADRFKRGRTRLNCTLPAPDSRWRWFGRQFYVAK